MLAEGWSISYKADPFSRRVIVTHYRGIIRKLLLDFKYGFSKALADDLSRIIIDFLLSQKITFPKKTILVPIPMYWYKENARGFNQVAEMGRVVAQKMNWQYYPDLLVKTKPSIPQAKLNKEARLQNLSGSFVVNSSYALSALPYTLVVFDDVVTTGATLREAGVALREAGFKNLQALVLSG